MVLVWLGCGNNISLLKLESSGHDQTLAVVYKKSASCVPPKWIKAMQGGERKRGKGYVCDEPLWGWDNFLAMHVLIARM